MTPHMPPHLPPATCSLDVRHKWSLAKWALFVVGMAALSGTTAALVVVAWLFPTQNGGVAPYIVNRGQGELASATSLDSEFVRSVRYRMIKVYDTGKSLAGGFYAEEGMVGDAVLLSSDGWSVLYYPHFKNGAESAWTGVDHQGAVHRITRTLFDARTGFLFIQFEGKEFRVATFPRWNDIARGTMLWRADGQWQRVVIHDTLVTAHPPFGIADEYSVLTVSPAPSAGSVMITDSGDLVGFSDGTGRLVSAWFAENQLPSILEHGKIAYRTVPWEGQFVDGVIAAGQWKELTGFYVSRVGRVEKSGLRKGDVIVKVNNQPIVRDTLHREILSAGEEFAITVARGEKEVELGIKK